MRYHPIIFFLLTISFCLCSAQKERNVWCFGHNAELNFNSGSPGSVSGCALNTGEGSASIADKNTGQLLFYTDGATVYNANNLRMPSNTIPLGGGYSTTQSALILPVPGSTHEYYIFCVAAQAGNNSVDSGVKYCVIDMNLDGGLGDVSQQPVQLISPTCEKIAATSMPNGQGYWVMFHLWNSDAFYTYPVTAAGVGAPVISYAGITPTDWLTNDTHYQAIGYMRISPDGSKIAMATDYEAHAIQVFNFDNASGNITGLLFSDTGLTGTNFGNVSGGPYGLCFSPNSQFLYFSIQAFQAVYQLNLLAGDSSAILASLTVVGSPSSLDAFALQLGPDQKIYIADGYDPNSVNLDRINSPNNAGLACGYQQNAVTLQYGNVLVGLPEFPPDLIQACQAAPVSIASDKLNICPSDSAEICAPDSFASYHWNQGLAGACMETRQAGAYYVVVTDHNGCTAQSDTLTLSVFAVPDDSIFADKTTFCSTDSAQICALTGYTFYQWNFGDTSTCIVTARPGNYSVKVTDKHGCSAQSDIISISVFTAPPDSIFADKTTFCSTDSAQICALAGYTSYQWNFGDTSTCIVTTQPGSYWVKVTDNHGCSAQSDTIAISVLPVPLDSIFSDKAIFCAGDSVPVCAQASFFTYQWNTGETTNCIYASQAGDYYVTFTDANSCTAESNHISVSVYPVPFISITVQGDTLSSFGAVSYQWYFNDALMPGDTLAILIAQKTGNYVVQITDSNGCSTISTDHFIMITGIENPGNDAGIIVYPNPSAGSFHFSGVKSGYTLKVYNVLGEEVYTGKVDHDNYSLYLSEEPKGVYFYRIEDGIMLVQLGEIVVE